MMIMMTKKMVIGIQVAMQQHLLKPQQHSLAFLRFFFFSEESDDDDELFFFFFCFGFYPGCIIPGWLTATGCPLGPIIICCGCPLGPIICCYCYIIMGWPLGPIIMGWPLVPIIMGYWAIIGWPLGPIIICYYYIIGCSGYAGCPSGPVSAG